MAVLKVERSAARSALHWVGRKAAQKAVGMAESRAEQRVAWLAA